MHSIRLRDPWQTEPLDGRVLYVRKFGLPTNLTSEVVYLVIEQITSQGTIELNGQLLGTQHPADGLQKYDIKSLLSLRNELRITVESPPTGLPGGLGEVRLEIED